MSLREDFLCKLCNKIQKHPVTLPCMCASVCKEHIDALHTASNLTPTINCPECSQNFDVPVDGFIENKLMRNLIEKNYYLSEEEKKLKMNLEKNLNQINAVLDEFKVKSSQFAVTQFDHFASMRREIDVKRETLIESIHKASAEMMRQIDETEEIFKKNFNDNLPNLTEIDVENETRTLNQLFQDEAPLNLEKIATFRLDHEQRLKDLQEKYENFKYFENFLTRNKFTPNMSVAASKFEPKSLGKLELFAQVQKLANENVIICCWDQNEIKMWNLNGTGGSVVKTFSGHSSGVCCLKVYDANKLISGSKDKTIKIWDMKTGECLQTFAGHTNDVRCLHLLSDNQYLASGGEDKNIKLWNLSNGACVSTLKGHTGYIFCLDQLPNGKLVSGSSDKSIRWWDLTTKTCTKVLLGHTDTVRCLKVVSSDSFASGSYDNKIRLWNVNSGECVQVLNGHIGSIYTLEMTPMRHLLSCSGDESIRVWDLTTGNCLKVLHGHKDNIYSIKLNRFGQLISGSHDKSIKIWDLDSGECLQTIHVDSLIWMIEMCKLF